VKRAERRRLERLARKASPKVEHHINLQNPVGQHFEEYIRANAAIRKEHGLPVVRENEAAGQSLVICGAGPSLREHAARTAEGDQVWGCNSAVVWLHEQGYKVTHGFTVDQTPEMLHEWATVPPVDFLLATSVQPELVKMLLGRCRSVAFFNNYVGIPKEPVLSASGPIEFEEWLYGALFPPTIKTFSGLNAVTRALDLARYMGFEKITVLGADCALKVSRVLDPSVPAGSPEHQRWLEDECVMHADGGNALASGATALTLEGEIDGRVWVTKPDMMITAVWMEKMRQEDPARIEYVGDTLPNALRDKTDEFLGSLPHFVDHMGNPLHLWDSAA